MSCKAACKSIPLEPPPFFNLTQLQPLLLIDDYNDDFSIHKTSKCYHRMKFKSASTTTTTLSHQQTTYVYLIIILIITIILLIFLIALIVGVYIVKLNRNNNNNNNNPNFYIKTSTMSSLSHDLLSLKPSDLRTTTATTSISSLTTPASATINKTQQSTQHHQYDSIRENANEFYYSYDALPTYNIIYNPYLNGHLV